MSGGASTHSSTTGSKERREGGVKEGSGESTGGRRDMTPRRQSASGNVLGFSGKEEELVDEEKLSEEEHAMGVEDEEEDLPGGSLFRHMSPSTLRTPKLKLERQKTREMGGDQMSAALPRNVRGEAETEEEGFLNLAPEVLERRTAKGKTPQKPDLLARDAPSLKARPRQREGVGLWQGGQGEQWWNPTDIQVGTKDTEFIHGVEKERGRMIREIAENDKYRAAMYANMTEEDWQKEEAELHEIQRLSLAELQQHPHAPEPEAAHGAPATLEDDDDDDNSDAAALGETVERMRRERPGKVYENLAEGMVDLCSNYLVKHGTEEERHEEEMERQRREEEEEAIRRGGDLSASTSERASHSVEMEDEREGITIFKPLPRSDRRSASDATPPAARPPTAHASTHAELKSGGGNGGVVGGGVVANDDDAPTATPAWKRLGRRKRELRAAAQQRRQDSALSAGPEGLDLLLKTPAAVRRFRV